MLALKYLFAAFIAAVGVIQYAATCNNLRKLSFFRSKVFAFIFMLITTAPALAYFFIWNEINETGVVEGGQQFYLFMLAVAASALFILGLSSLIQMLRKRFTKNDSLR